MPDSKRFLLRLDPRLFEALRRWADDDLRTDIARRAGRLPKHAPRRPPADAGADESSDPDAATVLTAPPAGAASAS